MNKTQNKPALNAWGRPRTAQQQQAIDTRRQEKLISALQAIEQCDEGAICCRKIAAEALAEFNEGSE